MGDGVMRKFAIYTLGFLAPIIAVVIGQNIWSRMTRLEARTADGTIYVVDRRTGETIHCEDRPEGKLPVTCSTSQAPAD
jgi:hypothetical protein